METPNSKFEFSILPDWSTLTIKFGDNLPHWTCPKACYHVLFRLVDSIPHVKLDEWSEERKSMKAILEKSKSNPSAKELSRLNYLFSKKIDHYLDLGKGACYLAKPNIADVVKSTLNYFNYDRYRLHAWCIMPNHVHVIVEPQPGYFLDKIIQSWKSYSANEANKELNKSGGFWQHESYDHIIRSETEYYSQIYYVWSNPDQAGVKALRWKLAGL